METEFWGHIARCWIITQSEDDLARSKEMAEEIAVIFISAEGTYEKLEQVIDNYETGDDDIGWVD